MDRTAHLLRTTEGVPASSNSERHAGLLAALSGREVVTLLALVGAENAASSGQHSAIPKSADLLAVQPRSDS